jgi:hypothetical protein
MSISKKTFGGSLAAILLATAGVASATTIYDFNTTEVPVFGAGPYGTVTLTQNGSNVNVTVALRSDLNFVSTGGGHSTFAFMVTNGALTTDVTNVLFNGASNTNYTVVAPGTGTPYGTNFTLMIDCTGNGCANGSPGQISDPLTFTFLNALESDFAYALSNGGAYFAADVICGPSSTLEGCNGGTGSIAVTGGPRPPDERVPEPGTLALLGLGMLGLGISRRRAKA